MSLADIDLTIKAEEESKIEKQRKDPTSFLPEEQMTYEIKKKKKKKKKKQEDPFKDVQEKLLVTEVVTALESEPDSLFDPEVTIKVEDIEVDLDFNEFANDTGLIEEGGEGSQEPAVKIENQNHDAVLLTFESIINENRLAYGYKEEPTIATEINTCDICQLVFVSPKSLWIHQKSKHKVYRRNFEHICDYCDMAYDQKTSLITHIKRKHGPGVDQSDRDEKSCETCGLVFKGSARLRMHMQRKHGLFQESFKHVCKDCGLSYDKSSSLITHKKRKHSKIKRKVVEQWLKCPFCARIFNKRETYARHVQRRHQVDDDGVPQNADDVFNSFKNQAGEWECTDCSIVFSSVNYLKLHLRRKHNALTEVYKLNCRFCGLSYNRTESLKRHIRRKHGTGINCNVCNKVFDTRESYMKHSHVKVVKECSICGQIFASQGGLAKHLRCTHKTENMKIVFCNICNEGFDNRRLLRPHLLKVHLKASYTCKVCKKVFKAKGSYSRHVMLKHPANQCEPEFQKCNHCTETFTDEFELCKHINIAHNEQLHKQEATSVDVKKEENGEDLYQCTKCSDMYASWDLLKAHFEQNHQQLIVLETQCQLCGDLLPETELQKHIKTVHVQNEETQCKYCEFKTNNKTSLTQHILRHKNASTMHCDYNGCRYKTYYESAMDKHKRKHMEQGVKLQCSKCTFQSMNKYIMRYHEEAHMTGKKKYACNECDYSTILPANLVQHKYKHSKEKRFKCEVCPFATKYNTSLRWHVRKKHCDLPTFS